MNLKWFNYFYLPLIVSLIIFYLCCLITNDDVPDVEIILPFGIQMDKVVHFCIYFGLSITAAFNYIRLNKGKVGIFAILLWTFVLPILYGGLIEIIQHYFCKGRSGDWYDLLADTLGSIVALPFIFYYRHYLLTKKTISK